jgi:hypothetical protein
MHVVRPRFVVWAALPGGALVLSGVLAVAPALVPAVLVLALASLVRLGDSLFDRVMVALALSVGLLSAAGLAFSLWPWGLDPLAITLAAWCGLWLLSASTGRPPRLPGLSAADLAVPVTVLVASLPAWRVVTAGGLPERLAVLMIGEDNSRHLMWWAGIRESGAYLFLAGERYPTSVVEGWDTYPQGWHLAAAVLDRFVGDAGVADPDRFMAWTLLTHAYLLLNVVWLGVATARRPGPLHVAAAAVVRAALATGSELARPLVSGYPAESLGLSMALAATAVCLLDARSERSRREAAVVLAATLVATAFGYYVFLLPQGLLVAAWLWHRRSDLLRAPVLLGVSAVVTLGLSAIMPVLGVAPAVGAGGLQVAGNVGPVVMSLVVLSGLAVAAGVLSQAWRVRGHDWVLVAFAAYIGFGAVIAVAVQSGYYVHKIWHVPIAVAAAMCAAVVVRLPRPAGTAARLRSGLALAGISVATALGAGLTPLGPGVFTDPKQGTSNLGVWRNDFWAQTSAASAVVRAMDEAPPEPDETSFVLDVDPYVSYRTNVFLSSLEGTSDDLFDVHYVGIFTQPERLRAQLDRIDGRVRLLATGPEAAALAEQVVGEGPDARRVRIELLRPAAD